MQGVVKALGVLLGRQSYCEENKCEGKLLPSHRTIEVVLLYCETLPPRHSYYCENNSAKKQVQKSLHKQVEMPVSLCCVAPSPAFPGGD